MVWDAGDRDGHLADPAVNIIRKLIHHFDAWLGRLEGVESFTDDPQCILRIQSGRAPHDILLPGGIIATGAKTVMLHLHNERIPPIPPGGADLAYAAQLYRLQIYSLKLVAKHILAVSSLHDIQAIGVVTAHVSLRETDGGRAMLEHLGFTVMPYYRPLGAFGEFWENFYAWWLMWTFNPASTRHRRLWDLQRTEFWISKERFLEKYGERQLAAQQILGSS